MKVGFGVAALLLRASRSRLTQGRAWAYSHRMHGRRRILLFLLTSAACRPAAPGPAAPPLSRKPSAAGPARSADVVVRGGVIHTMDPAAPTTHALAASGGVIIALGDAALDRRLVNGRTRVVDLRGGSAMPGLTDAHAHLVALGATLEEVDLRGARSVEECVRRLKAGAPRTGWITGRGWDQNLWPEKEMPTHRAPSEAFPDRVVWLRRVDGHAGWGNRALLEAAGGMSGGGADPQWTTSVSGRRS